MKKILLSVVLLITLFTHNQVKADELTLYSNDNFDVSSDAFIQDEKDYISLVKDSILSVTFKNNQDFLMQKSEPKVDLKVVNSETKKVIWSVKPPVKKMSAVNGPVFENYLKENKPYFDAVRLNNKNVEMQIPLNFPSGKYTVELTLENEGKSFNLTYDFTLSESYYTFTTSDILIEDENILAKIGYISYSKTDDTNKVVVTLNQGDAEIFRKEIDHKFYTEGVVTIDEKVPALNQVKGDAELRIEVKDKDGKVILSQIQSINMQKSGGKMLYYILLAILVIILVLVFMVLKNKKIKTIAIVLTFGLILFTGVKVLAVAGDGTFAWNICDGVTKPANVCVENKIKTWLCNKTNSCATQDVRAKKFFSTGTVKNIESDKVWVGPVSRSVNVCDQINTSFVTGDRFYVISSSEESDHERKRYHIFKFTKGTSIIGDDDSGAITFDPGGDKRNVNYATYNGNCNVTVFGRYSGRSSDYKDAKTTIVEVGKITPNMCKSKVVNDTVFEEKGNSSDLIGKSNCTEGQLRDTFIAGSVYMEPVYNTDSSWSNKTANICTYLGVNSGQIANLNSQNKKFYALMHQESSWTMITHPVFEFKFGVASPDAGMLNYRDKVQYYYDAYKENSPFMTYDGLCTVTFRLNREGADTDQHSQGYKLIELGMVENATCRDSRLTDGSKYRNEMMEKHSKFGLTDAETGSTNTFFMKSKYSVLAPFFFGDGKLSVCKATTQCSTDGKWIGSFTDTTCGITPNSNTVSSCNGTRTLTSTTTTTNTSGVTTTSTATQLNSPTCALRSTCSVSDSGLDSSVSVSTLENRRGNITYSRPNNTPVTKTGSDAYQFTVPKTANPQSIVVTLRDIDAATAPGGNSTSTCIIPGTDDVVDTTTCSCSGTTQICTGTNPSTTNNSPSCIVNTTTCSCSGTTQICTGTNPSTTNNHSSCVLPLITLTKNPLVSLNKGGSCTIAWSISNMPSDTTCTLSGGTSSKNITVNGSEKILNLQSNTRFTIKCSGGGLSKEISKSVVCRVNPTIIEE